MERIDESSVELSGFSGTELGHAARRSLAKGDFAEAVRAKHAKDTAESILRCNNQDLARRIADAAQSLEDEDSLLWTLARNFHLISRKKQIDLVERCVKGFVELPPEDQAKAVLALAPRIRAARRGWAEGSSKKKKKDKSRGRESTRPAEEPGAGFPPLVGARGRREADSTIVGLLDSLDGELRCLADEDRARLHRRMDRAVSTNCTPLVLGRMLTHLPVDEVKAIEKWVVDEGALPPPAAARLFGALIGAQKAGGFLQDAADGLYLSAEDLWVRLSKEFASQPDEISDSWSNWLQGRPPSPGAQSVLGNDFDEDDNVSVAPSMPSRRHTAPTPSSLGRRSIGPAQPGGGYGSLSSAGSLLAKKRASCQLHCPASAFLFTDAKPSAAGGDPAPARRPSQQMIDFVMVDASGKKTLTPSIDKTQIDFEDGERKAESPHEQDQAPDDQEPSEASNDEGDPLDEDDADAGTSTEAVASPAARQSAAEAAFKE